MTIAPPLAAPLLQAMRDLLAQYTRCMECAEDLMTSLVAGIPSVIQAAVASQTAAFAKMEAAERRRRQAELALTRAITGWNRSGLPKGRLTATALLALLPAEEAAELAGVRRELLQTLVRLQAMQSQNGVLARSALSVLRRTCTPTGPAATYGPHGERDAASSGTRRQVWRSA
jgi:flagellar biosynthesis/type III secretory pathway chaperone